MQEIRIQFLEMVAIVVPVNSLVSYQYILRTLEIDIFERKNFFQAFDDNPSIYHTIPLV